MQPISNPRWLSLWLVIVFATTAQAQGPVTAIAFAPGENQVLFGSQNGIEIRSWPNLARLNSLPTEMLHVHDLKFSPDGTQLLAAGGSPAEIGEVEVWSWPDQARIRRIADHSDLVYRVAWSPDGRQWASGSGDTRCFVYDSVTGEKRVTYNGHSRAVLGLCWLDSNNVISAGLDQTVRLWGSTQGNHLRTLDNHVGSVNALALRPGVAHQKPESEQVVLVTVADDNTVRLWQPKIGRLLRFARLDSTPRCVVWSADASQLLVGCSDGRIRIIPWDNLAAVSEFEGGVGRVLELALTPSGKHLMVGGEAGFRSHPR